MSNNMKLGLIPRVRVNYTFSDLLNALFVCEKDHSIRDYCEQKFSEIYAGRPVCLVGSGRAALYLILKSLPQKKVVLPAYNCEVVTEAAEKAGKEIIYAECDKLTFNIKSLPQLNRDTVVVAVHQYGLPCDIKAIKKACNEVGAVLVEDCAAALGTKVDGQLVGTFGDYAFVSFNASKLLHVPSKGGLIIAKDDLKLDAIKDISALKSFDFSFKAKHMIRGLIFCMCKNIYLYWVFHYLAMGRCGKLRRNEHEGYQFRPDDSYQYGFAEWQASILRRQIGILEGYIGKNQMIFSYYDDKIQNPLIEKPKGTDGAVCCRYPIYVKNKRDFYKKSTLLGVDLDSSHSVITCPKSFGDEWIMAKEVLNIPLYPGLNESEMKAIVNVINAIR